MRSILIVSVLMLVACKTAPHKPVEPSLKVVEKPVTPPGPPSLAVTGAGWTWAGIITALVLLATGATLWFGRRLALYRERTGYVRDEDLVADLDDLTKG